MKDITYVIYWHEKKKTETNIFGEYHDFYI